MGDDPFGICRVTIRHNPVSEIGCIFDIRHASVECVEVRRVYCDVMKPHYWG